MEKAAISTQLENDGKNLCKSNLRITNLMSAEKSSDVKVCSGKGVIHHKLLRLYRIKITILLITM